MRQYKDPIRYKRGDGSSISLIWCTCCKQFHMSESDGEFKIVSVQLCLLSSILLCCCWFYTPSSLANQRSRQFMYYYGWCKRLLSLSSWTIVHPLSLQILWVCWDKSLRQMVVGILKSASGLRGTCFSSKQEELVFEEDGASWVSWPNLCINRPCCLNIYEISLFYHQEAIFEFVGEDMMTLCVGYTIDMNW